MFRGWNIIAPSQSACQDLPAKPLRSARSAAENRICVSRGCVRAYGHMHGLGHYRPVEIRRNRRKIPGVSPNETLDPRAAGHQANSAPAKAFGLRWAGMWSVPMTDVIRRTVRYPTATCTGALDQTARTWPMRPHNPCRV